MDIETEELFQKTFYSQLDAIFILNSKIPPRIVNCNPAATHLFGYSRQEMIGRATNFLHVNETSLQNFQKQLYPEIDENGFFKLPEYKMKRKDGTAIFTEHSVVPLNDTHNKRIGWVSVVREISESKRVLEALQNSEEKYRGLFHRSNDAIFVHDLDGNIIDANQKVLELFGYTKSEIASIKIPKLHPTEALEKSNWAFETILREGFVSFEVEFKKKSGELFSADVSSSLFRLGGKKVIQGIVRDITERKRSEKELKKYERIVSSSSDHLALLDRNYIYQTVNDSYLKTQNKKREDIVGYSVPELFGREFFEKNQKHNIDRCLTGETVQYQLWVKFPSLGQRYMDVIHYPYYEEDGSISGYVVNARDVTDRKRAEEAHANALNELKEFMNAIPDIAYRIKNDLTITNWNHAAEEILGYSSEEISRMNALEFFPYEDHEKVAKAIQKVYDIGKSEIEAYFLTKDKKKIPCLFSGRTSKDSEGNITGLAGIAKDLTLILQAEEEKKNLETQLRQAQKMEAIGTLASGISHNFRNILTVISMNCQIFQGKYKDDTELMTSIDSMLSYVDRGAKLVNQLLEFSSQKPKKEFQFLNLSGMLKEIYQLIKQAYDKLIDIRLNVPDSITISGDNSELSQVFMNICANAKDAMPSGGILRIEAAVEENQARVVISDTGQGMDKVTLAKCFEPFFTTKPVDKGTGLGLSTAYGTVKKHGGEILVQSELGHGTTFKLYFPLCFYDLKTEPKISKLPNRILNKKILIVDDEIEICRLIKKSLIQLGYRVEYVDNGKAAIGKYQSWRPDVVLLDRNMPGMDGISCVEKIVNYDSHAKILFISGYNENGPAGLTPYQKKFIKGYLTKPIHINELNTRLLNLL